MRIVRALAWVSVLALSAELQAERYIVKDDVFGSTDAVPLGDISEEELAALKQKQASSSSSEVSSEEGSVDEPFTSASGPSSQPSEQTSLESSPDAALLASDSETLQEESAVQPANQASTESQPSADLDQIEPIVERKNSPFEQEYLRTEASQTDEVIKRLRQQGRESDYDATEVNPANFVDSENLLQGNVNNTGEQPFYLTIDSDGTQDVVFYSPEVIRQEIERRKIEERVSESSIHLPPLPAKESEFPSGAEPEAMAILNSGGRKSYYERFVERCCANLPNVGMLNLTLERTAYVNLSRDSLSYRFTDGDSRYGLVRLPSLNSKYLLVLKSFVRRFEDRGIESGAFIPQVVVLDGESRVKRVISNFSLQANAETWRSHGFLKAVIEVDQTEVDADRYLLIYTTKDDLRRYTIIEDTQKPWQIKHMEVGAVEVSVVAESIGKLE